jgi:hypothetical protein
MNLGSRAVGHILFAPDRPRESHEDLTWKLTTMRQTTIDDYLKTARFEGPVNAADCARLEGQLRRIYELMVDGEWRSLADIERITGFPQASISAQLRHLRKTRFGSHSVEKRRRGESGTWEYQVKRRDQA